MRGTPPIKAGEYTQIVHTSGCSPRNVSKAAVLQSSIGVSGQPKGRGRASEREQNAKRCLWYYSRIYFGVRLRVSVRGFSVWGGSLVGSLLQ